MVAKQSRFGACQLLILLLAGEAGADVALVHGGAGSGDPEDLRQVLRTLQQREEGAVIHGETVRQLTARAAGEPHIARGRQKAREGWLLLGHMRVSEARSALEESLASYAIAQESPAACEAAWTPLHDLAFAEWQGGNKVRAASLALGASTLVSREVDPDRYPPPFIRFLKRLRSKLPQAVSVLSRPPGAEVWINCKVVGRTPLRLSVSGVGIGKVTLPGHHAWAGLIDPEKGGGLLQNQLRRLPSESSFAGDVAKLRKMAAALGVERIAIWRRTEAGLELRTYVDDEHSLGPWKPLVAAPPPIAPPLVKRRPARSRAALWITGGGAIAMLTAGTVFGVLAKNAATGLEEAAEQGRVFDDELAAQQDRRDAFGTTAYVLWSLGAVAAAATAVLWALSKPKPKKVTRLPLSIGTTALQLEVRFF